MISAILGERPIEEWISKYAESHQNPINRVCHTIGIPMIAAAVPLFGLSVFVPGLWTLPTMLFVVGWIIQFIGHYFEGKKPEFLSDWRFLFVGLRWWTMKMAGRA